MKLELVDSLSLPGNPEKANDDAFAYRETAAIVLDGATGLGERLMPGPSDAAWLARFGANRIMSYLGDGARPQEAVTAALFDADTSFAQLRRRPPQDRYEIPFASMMLVVAEAGGLECLWYGDCAALVGHAGGRVEIVGEAIEKRAREARRVKRLAESQGEATAAVSVREQFLPALRSARNLVNTEKAGYLFGPEVIAADHAQARRVAVAPGTHVLLVTDGFLALASDYGRYDLAGLLAAAKGKGLAALMGELRDVEDADPEGRQFPRFKKSDDATAVLVRVV
ncbi:MAG TPA: protein phosphatase 2C domain-containing protein [Rhizomicrobium sp.]|nr:protein phosphatase 2C domain-containing protein [Rhizomicrobium sp.]